MLKKIHNIYDLLLEKMDTELEESYAHGSVVWGSDRDRKIFEAGARCGRRAGFRWLRDQMNILQIKDISEN